MSLVRGPARGTGRSKRGGKALRPAVSVVGTGAPEALRPRFAWRSFNDRGLCGLPREF
jgi:hypothetical protein